MASVREIKRRIQSVKNIGQVTRALEAVSASRARRSQQQAAYSRAYTQKAWEILVNLSGQPSGNEHPLMATPENVEAIDLVLITSDRGLAGAYNMNIIRAAEDFVDRMGVPVRWITVGRKGRDYLLRRRRNVIAEFSNLPSDLPLSAVSPVGDMIVKDFLDGHSQQVFVAYTDFINVLTQRPAVVSLLPLQPFESDMVALDYFKPAPEQTIKNQPYIYEPEASAILDQIVPRFTALQIYQAVLEAAASEHAARMVAMRNATDNAASLVEDLTLVYNKARQLAITSEILDIVGGVEALKASDNKNDKAVKLADDFINTFSAAVESDKKNGKKDNLKLIEGIGPKVEQALNGAGITTYAQLAAAKPADLIRIVKDEAKVRIVGDAATWPKQASFLVKGDQDGLKAYQDILVGGREPEK
jgi:F-type H+-transporting ATPase subunit gamma